MSIFFNTMMLPGYGFFVGRWVIAELMKEGTKEDQRGIFAVSWRMSWDWASQGRRKHISGGRGKVKRGRAVGKDEMLTEDIALPPVD